MDNSQQMISTREIAGQTLLELGAENPNMVVIGGDLNKSTYSNMFGSKYPDRFFDMGAAEQNMISIAAGLAASGKIPVVSTFAVFGTSRPYDQLRVGVSQPNLNVKLILTHAGLLTGEDGISAQSIEDIGIMATLPNFSVVVPADGIEARESIKVAMETEGPFYIRLSRPAIPVIHGDDFEFQLGKAGTVHDGDDVTIVACGIMVNAALEAAAVLDRFGVSCRVLNMSTIKPIDTMALVKAARETGAIVTAEEHYINSGLGSLVSHTLSRLEPVPIESIALHGYAESGQPDELFTKYHLNYTDIEHAVRVVLDRKKRSSF
jgi:transketolase